MPVGRGEVQGRVAVNVGVGEERLLGGCAGQWDVGAGAGAVGGVGGEVVGRRGEQGERDGGEVG